MWTAHELAFVLCLLQADHSTEPISHTCVLKVVVVSSLPAHPLVLVCCSVTCCRTKLLGVAKQESRKFGMAPAYMGGRQYGLQQGTQPDMEVQPACGFHCGNEHDLAYIRAAASHRDEHLHTG
jgi:hypothetical protein